MPAWLFDRTFSIRSLTTYANAALTHLNFHTYFKFVFDTFVQYQIKYTYYYYFEQTKIDGKTKLMWRIQLSAYDC